MDKTEMGHSVEGRLLVGHGPREWALVAADSSFVEQPVEGVGRFSRVRPPPGLTGQLAGRRCLNASRAT